MTDVATDEAADAHDGSAKSASAPSSDTKRERSAVAFAYSPLSEAVEVVRAVERRGHTCTVDELAAELNQQMTSGAFRNKISAARLYGVIDVSRQVVTLTDIGRRIISPDTHAQALADAFMHVPLYRLLYDQFAGNNLPPDQGIEAAMRRVGVPEKQTVRARQILFRSAETAGFFSAGRNRLVRPAGSSLPTEPHAGPGTGDRNRGSSGAETVPMAEHPLIKGLVAKLPPEGERFTPQQRRRWLDAAKVNLELIYAADDEDADPTPASLNGVASVQPQPS
jgi:hypothetical protein